MPTLTQLKTQGLALVDKQKALIQNDPRPWSQKKPEFDRIEADIQAIVTQVDRLKAVDGNPFERLLDDQNDWRSTAGKGALSRAYGITGKAIPTPSLVIDDDQARELYDAAKSARSLAVDLKTPTDSTSILPAGISGYRLPPLTMRREPTRVLELLPTVGTDRPVETYYTTTGTTAAAAVAEGGAKPQSSLSYTAATATMTKIAHYVSVTDETLSDFSGFMQALQSDMVAGLILKESTELLTATVTGAHKFAGLLPSAGITRAKDVEMGYDTIALAFDDLRNGTSYVEPDGIVMHPTDWGTLRRLKDDVGRYYIDPDPSQAAPLSLWGVPVKLTTGITQGTALVGSFAEGALAFIREGIRVEVANQGTTEFTTNTTLIRAEERLSLAVVRPTCFVKVTGL